MKRRVLLPTDFSKSAQNAIDYASTLYKADKCDFYILNTYDVDTDKMSLGAVRDIEESKNESVVGLTNILKQLSTIDNSKNHQYHMVSECGSLIDIMKELIDKLDIDLVAMGTKGKTNSVMQIYGSNTVLAMEKIRNCPVLAIPEVASFKGIKEIVFPTDYRMQFKRREFQYLTDISKNSEATIRVLHVLKKGEQLDADQLNNQNLLKDYFEGFKYSFHSSYDMAIHDALDSFIKKNSIDLVAFINRKHSLFSNIFSLRRPMMKELGYNSNIPILTLHDLKN